jgi:hypothetical protein
MQRWSARRVVLAIAVVAVLLVAVDVSMNAFRPVGAIGAYPPVCGTGHSMILSAQAVPASARLPCIAALPSGWTVGGTDIRNGQEQFWLDSDQAGQRAVTITLTATCDTSRASRIPSDQPGAARFERPLSLQPQFTLLRMYTFAGGCVTYRFSFVTGAPPALAIPVDTAIAFEPRSTLVGYLKRTENLVLCGRDAPCPR